MSKQYCIALTGAAGFLGKSMIQELCAADAQGLFKIERLVLLDIVDIDTSGYEACFDMQSVIVDIRDKRALKEHLKGMDLVIHSASMIDWGNHPDEVLHAINVEGTAHVLNACKANQVPRLIYTSTMDVLHTGKSIVNGDETLPYPENFNDKYAETKADAEKLVLKNNSDGLRTSVIRPCGIYGPADPYHITESLKAVKSGALKFRVGDGSALFQHVYVGNVAFGHIMLAKAMLNDQTDVHGEVYLITDDPAENFFDFLAPVVEALGYPFPPKNRYIPYSVMYGLASMVEAACFCIKPFKQMALPITRSSVRTICEDLTFSTDKAHRHFDYSPKYTKSEAFEATIAYFKALEGQQA